VTSETDSGIQEMNESMDLIERILFDSSMWYVVEIGLKTPKQFRQSRGSPSESLHQVFCSGIDFEQANRGLG